MTRKLPYLRHYKKVRSIVDSMTGCDNWILAKTPKGYGLEWDSENQRMTYAHILAWERTNGNVPKGKELDHIVCSNPSCRNPKHLKPVTRKENLYRSERWLKNFARRDRHKECFTPKQKRQIARMYHVECKTQLQIAKYFKTYQPKISRTLKRMKTIV